MRVSDKATFRTLTSHLGGVGKKLENLHIQAATGKRINKASDEPSIIRPLLNTRNQLTSAKRYVKSMDLSLDRFMRQDGFLDKAGNIMIRAKEINTYALNGALTNEDLRTLQTEVEQLTADLLGLANTEVGGRHMFAGYIDDAPPFRLVPQYPNMNGNVFNDVASSTSSIDGVMLVDGNPVVVAGAGTDQQNSAKNIAAALNGVGLTATAQTNTINLGTVHTSVDTSLAAGDLTINGVQVTGAISSADSANDLKTAIDAAAIPGLTTSISSGQLLLEMADGSNIQIETTGAQADGQVLLADFNLNSGAQSRTSIGDVTVTKPSTISFAGGIDASTYGIGHATSPVEYLGDNGDINLEISPSEKVKVNVTGNALFLGDSDFDGNVDPGAVDIFNVMQRLQSALASGDTATLNATMGELETGADQVRRIRSSSGVVARSVEEAREHTDNARVDLEEILSNYENADLLQVLAEMTKQETALEATLNITARVSKATILNYL